MTDQERYEIMYDEIVDLKNDIKHKDDLINRQKAEIEKLKTVKQHINALICRGVEYPTTETYEEAFQKAVEQLYDATNAKAESIKEFAERFKGIAGIYQKDTYVIGVDEFDNLVKEMVGDGE